METIKNIFIYFIAIFKLFSQEYSIDILGLHATDVSQIKTDSSSIIFKAQNRGLFDFIWPTNNYYETKYVPKKFIMKSWRKKIKQGDYNLSLSAKKVTNNHFLYNDEKKINVPQPIYNVFSLLAMIQSSQRKYLDSKWFNLEHEGSVGRARFIWADSSNIWDGRDSVMCDHYRFDIFITDSTHRINKTTDYFMQYIVNPNFVREVWVSTEENKIIMAARLSTPWISLYAKVNSLQ